MSFLISFYFLKCRVTVHTVSNMEDRMFTVFFFSNVFTCCVSIVSIVLISTIKTVTMQITSTEPISRPFIHMEASSVLELNENVMLNCSHDNGTRTTYRWLKGGKPLTNVTRFVLSSDQKLLTITRVLMADDDIYSCVVENPVGSMTSLPIRLTVYSK